MIESDAPAIGKAAGMMRLEIEFAGHLSQCIDLLSWKRSERS
jgi:hypothetical protein